MSGDYKPGDVANGHVWTGTQWLPVQTQPAPPLPTSAYAGGVTPAYAPKNRRRVFLWVFLAIQALFILWIISGATSSNSTADCGSLSAAECQGAQNLGKGIGVALIIGLWATVDIILGISYGVYRLAKRP